ncbi:ArnT family glycosyltransferase [Glaciecola sp. 1036]|uniref:ArnT family glycosyltransferase n=1 Tax=Alteromonadaceae TaxID=72275 RepID=UPI003CFE16CD
MNRLTRKEWSSISFKLLCLVACFYLFFPNARLDFTDFNSHDSEGYLTLSYNMLHQGYYSFSFDENEYLPHMLWPPGMPIILSPAVYLSGDTLNFYLVKYTMILIGIVGIFAVRKLLIEFNLNRTKANIAAIFFALNPFYWHFSRISMAEVPIICWLLISLILLSQLFSKDNLTYRRAIFAGAFAGFGMLIKGMMIGIAAVPLVLIFYRKLDVKKATSRYFVFMLIFIIPFAIWNLRNAQIDRTGLGFDGVNQIQMITKEVIEDPESPTKTVPQILQSVKENFLWHAIYHIPNHTLPLIRILDLKQTTFGNFVAIGLCVLILLLSLRGPRLLTLSFLIMIAPIVLLILPMTIGGAERYWFNITTFIGLLLFIGFLQLSNASIKRLLIPSLFILQIVSLSLYIVKLEKDPYSHTDYRNELVQVFDYLSDFCAEQPVDIYTGNAYSLALTTNCTSARINIRRGLNPSFDYIVKEKQNIDDLPPYKVLFETENLAFVHLASPITGKEIMEQHNASH